MLIKILTLEYQILHLFSNYNLFFSFVLNQTSLILTKFIEKYIFIVCLFDIIIDVNIFFIDLVKIKHI